MFVHSPRVFSGVQPTGRMHLGNYLGALKSFAVLQHKYECLFCVVDLHAITVDFAPSELAENTRSTAAAIIASGVDPERAIIYPQSSVSIHAILAWILACVARMGWLERMTQFKDKSGANAQRASVGLFAYPVLQAADILGFRATHVPVGEDQKQHLELARDIAQKFNQDFSAPDFFPLPEPLTGGVGTRVMSLKDGSKKMSKSDPADLSRINLDDDTETIARKIRKAKTDAELIPETAAELENRAEASNLLQIYAALSGLGLEATLARFAGQGFAGFKRELADLAVESISPVSRRFAEIISDRAGLDAILRRGTEQAQQIAAPIEAQLRERIGFWGTES